MNRIDHNLTWEWLTGWVKKIVAWSDAITSGRWWLIKSWVIFLAVSVLISGGFDFQNRYTDSYYLKVQHPMTDMGKITRPGCHEEKLTFRLTVPFLLHVAAPYARWTLPALTIASIALMPLVSAMVAWQLTASRVVGFYMGLLVASTYVGSFGIIAFYDAFAWLQIALACLPRLHWLLRALLCYTCSFTDERGLAGFGLVLALCFLRSEGPGLRKYFTRDTFAIVGAMFLFIVTRFWLQFALGMQTSLKGVGPNNAVCHVPELHANYWFGLEGGWVLVTLACLSLFMRRHYLRLAIFLIPLLGLMAASALDGDMLRCTVFAFPATFMALLILFEHESHEKLVSYLLIAVGLSLISGNYDVFGGKTTWLEPLPIQFLDAGVNAFVNWLKAIMHYQE